MIWFNIKKLERKLANDDFPETLGYVYLIIFLSLLTSLYFLPHKASSSGNDFFRILTVILTLLISLWGTNRIMGVNRNGSNKDFIKKFLALSFVAGVRLVTGLTVFLLIIKYLHHLVQNFYPGLVKGLLFGDISKLFLASVLSIFFFQILINSFRRINEMEEMRLRN